MIDALGDLGVTLGGDGDDLALARLDLGNVRHHLVVNGVFQGNHDHRHILIDQGDRPVFHFRGRVSLGMDIGYFLQLEGALHCDRVVYAPTEVETVVGGVVFGGDGLDLLFAAEDLLDSIGNTLDMVYKFPPLLNGQMAHAPEQDGYQREDHYLRGKGLG